MTNRKISVILQREQDSSYTGKLWEITGGKSDLEFKKIADKIDTSHNFLSYIRQKTPYEIFDSIGDECR